MIRVEIPSRVLMQCRSEAELQFVTRLMLHQAGIPLGPWNSSAPERGALSWHDTFSGTRVIEWHDNEPSPAGRTSNPN